MVLVPSDRIWNQTHAFRHLFGKQKCLFHLKIDTVSSPNKCLWILWIQSCLLFDRWYIQMRHVKKNEITRSCICEIWGPWLNATGILKNICMTHAWGHPEWFPKCCEFVWSSIHFNRSDVFTNIKWEIFTCTTQVKNWLNIHSIDINCLGILKIISKPTLFAKNKLKKRYRYFYFADHYTVFSFTCALVFKIIFFKNI